MKTETKREKELREKLVKELLEKHPAFFGVTLAAVHVANTVMDLLKAEGITGEPPHLPL